jgi:hypothetical protein
VVGPNLMRNRSRDMEKLNQQDARVSELERAAETKSKN